VNDFWPCAFTSLENKIQAARVDRNLKNFIKAILENKGDLALSGLRSSKAQGITQMSELGTILMRKMK
jgi:hypothetical protein